jgi:hypothetical protein
MCKSDWNFDYHGIIFLKEIPWSKSTGLWTDERAPFRGSNLGHPSGFRRPRTDGDEAAAAKGGAEVEPPESHRNGASVR